MILIAVLFMLITAAFYGTVIHMVLLQGITYAEIGIPFTVFLFTPAVFLVGMAMLILFLYKEKI